MLAAIQAKRAQARQEGSKRLYQSYAQPVPTASWNMRQFFRADTIEPVRQALLVTSNEYQGRLFVADDHVHQLSLPVHVDKPDGTAALVGSINDTLDYPSIAEFPLATANQWFLSLTKAPDATPGATNVFAVAIGPSPDQVGPPAPAEGEAEPPSLLRLDFDGTDLRFGVFPLMPPVPCGVNIPPAHPLQLPFPEDVIETAPFLEEWRRAAAWTVRLNNGLSINHGGPMFAPDAIELQPDTFLQHFDTTVNSIQLDYNLVRPATELHYDALTRIVPAADAAWDRIAATLPAPNVTASDGPVTNNTPGPLATPSPATTSDSNRFLETILARALTARTPDEKEAADQTSKVKSIYRLLTAGIDEGTHQLMTPGTLTEHFSSALEKKKTEATQDELVDGVNESNSSIRSNHHYLSYATNLNGRMFDIPLTTAIKKAALYTTSFELHSKPAQQLSVLSFASPTKEVLSRLQADSAALNHAAVGNDTTSITTNHEVFVGGKLNSLLDVQTLIANLMAFIIYMCVEPERSELYKSLHKLLFILNDQHAKNALGGRRGQPQIAHTLAGFTQDIFASFAIVAKSPLLYKGIKANRNLEADPLRQAIQYADAIVTHVKNTIFTAPQTFELPSILWELLHPAKEAKAPPQSGNHGNPTFPRSSYETPPATGKRTAEGQRKPPGSTPSATTSAAAAAAAASRLVGFLTVPDTVNADDIKALSGKVPAFLPAPNGGTGKERLCLRHCIKGWACGYGTNCKFPHPNSFRSIDRANQDKLAQWVRASDNILDFVAGEGPSVHLRINKLPPLAPSAPTASAPLLSQEARLSALVASELERATPATNPAPAPPDEPAEHPKYSDILQRPSPAASAAVASVSNNYSRRDLDAFATRTLSPRVQAVLNQSFGKPNCNQCFLSEPVFRHTLAPMLKSNFLSAIDWTNLAATCRTFRTFLQLWIECTNIDPTPLRGFNTNWEAQHEINKDHVKQATAALLQQFDGDAGALVRWIGGPHVGAYRNVNQIITDLRGTVPDSDLADLQRLFTNGMPAVFNAEETEANYRTYERYGNHSTINEDPDLALQALIKEQKKGWCIVLDKRVLPFLLNVHLTPIGLINVGHAFKKLRLIWDASFRPEPWCNAINDMSTLDTEPPITFADAFDVFLLYLANLRVSYPDEEIYLGEDDVGGAFKHNKFHPDLVAAHASIQGEYVVLATGSTFGGKTSPSNWNTLAVCRQHRAQHLWHQPDIVARAAPFLPPIIMAEPPTAHELSKFAKIERDACLPGVYDAHGKRIAPPYSHWVDDNSYADVRDHMHRTVSASAIALFDVLGYPDPRVPNPLSQDKLNTQYTHQRRIVGYQVDSRTMTVGLLPSKREEAVRQLSNWLDKTEFTLREAATLNGMIDSMARYNRWGRTYLTALQHEIRQALTTRYGKLTRDRKIQLRAQQIAEKLPRSALHRTSSLVAQHIARALWNDRIKIGNTAEVKANIRLLRDLLANPTNKWEEPIAFIVQRTPHATSIGDASGVGGGAYCERLQFWFDITWSEKVRHALESKQVDINCLEFVVVLLQYAAAIERFRHLPNAIRHRLYPSGTCSQFPVILVLTDNTSAAAWAKKLSTSTAKNGHHLILVFAELLRQASLGINSEHIPGVDNEVADFLSRPDSLPLPRPARLEQIFQRYSYLQTWNYFQPSPELLQLLVSSLFKKPSPDRPALPRKLGHFVPGACSTSSSPTI